MVLDGSNLDHPASVLHETELLKGRSESKISPRSGYWVKDGANEAVIALIIAVDFMVVGFTSVLAVLMLSVVSSAQGWYGAVNRSPQLNQLHDLFTSRSGDNSLSLSPLPPSLPLSFSRSLSPPPSPSPSPSPSLSLPLSLYLSLSLSLSLFRSLYPALSLSFSPPPLHTLSQSRSRSLTPPSLATASYPSLSQPRDHTEAATMVNATMASSGVPPGL
jgi:hypothetical protein